MIGRCVGANLAVANNVSLKCASSLRNVWFFFLTGRGGGRKELTKRLMATKLSLFLVSFCPKNYYFAVSVLIGFLSGFFTVCSYQ